MRRSNVQGAGVDGVVIDLRVDELVQFEDGVSGLSPILLGLRRGLV